MSGNSEIEVTVAVPESQETPATETPTVVVVEDNDGGTPDPIVEQTIDNAVDSAMQAQRIVEQDARIAELEAQIAALAMVDQVQQEEIQIQQEEIAEIAEEQQEPPENDTEPEEREHWFYAGGKK